MRVRTDRPGPSRCVNLFLTTGICIEATVERIYT